MIKNLLLEIIFSFSKIILSSQIFERLIEQETLVRVIRITRIKIILDVHQR